MFSQYDNDADEDELLSNITDCAEAALLDSEISQMKEDQLVLGLHYRPSTVIVDEIESTENEQVKMKEEIESMRRQAIRSTQNKYDERVTMAQAELSNAEKDRKQELMIIDKKCNAMQTKSDVGFKKMLAKLKSEHDETHGRELQPGTPENARKSMTAIKEKEIHSKMMLKRKLSFKPEVLQDK